MKNRVTKKIRIIKKNVKRDPVKIRCGSIITTITFTPRKDGRVKGGVSYHTNYSAPVIRDIREIQPEDPEEEA